MPVSPLKSSSEQWRESFNGSQTHTHTYTVSSRFGLRSLVILDMLIVCVCLVAQLCPTPWDPMDCSPPGSSVHGDSPGKNAGVGCHAPLQGIFPTQRSNPSLPHCRRILYRLRPQEARVSSSTRSINPRQGQPRRFADGSLGHLPSPHGHTTFPAPFPSRSQAPP